MNLLSGLILPKLKKELLELEPEVAQFILNQLKSLASEVLEWIEEKVQIDLNGDGEIGDNNKE